MRGAEYRVGEQKQLEGDEQGHYARNQHEADIQKIDAICIGSLHYIRGA
jgi:hypothetical protein